MFAVPCDPSRDSWDYSPHTGLLKHAQSAKCLKVDVIPLLFFLYFTSFYVNIFVTTLLRVRCKGQVEVR